MPPAPIYASTRGGTRYHADWLCTGLTATHTAGDPVPAITRAAALTRRLQPCALCTPVALVPLALVP